MAATNDNIQGLLDKPRKAGRPKKGEENPVLIAEKADRELLALRTSSTVVAESGFRSNDPSFKDLQLISMTRQGIAPTRAAELLGFTKMQSTRVFQKLKKNPKFKQKVDDMIGRSIEAYKRSAQTLLPEITELDLETIKQYKADPSKLLERPKAIQNLRVAAGAALPDGTTLNESPISITTIERLQVLVHDALLGDQESIEHDYKCKQ